ncbi:uncharacterized protein LOC110728177 [Chenopodium quinoa]|uniref:uncharacterized protein LOC110728177 n=1 Tax=Chenopodium quinoa TaxID=63459 RepID=UPI000B77C321|nr:uncharacterized protein LOC110728177 [Chenopodium quinoa]
MVQKPSRFLTTTSFNPPTLNKYPKQHEEEEEEEEEEFNECDVVWSTSSSPEKTTTVENPAITISSTTGISAALLIPEEPRSPTSIQRKTTTSPVSMISSSFSRGNGPGLAGYYYGRKFHQSAPVNVPVWPNGLGSRRKRAFVGLGRFDEMDDGGDLLDDDGEEMVPPHEIVARSHNATSFSVMEGAGRTLKGRDLTTVRNAVFQKTGFLD